MFSAYGKGDYAKTLIMSLIKDLKSNKPINLSPCVHIWNFTYYKDVARAIIGLTNAESGIYNITNSDNIPLKNYVEVIKKLINDAAIINYGFYEYKNGVPDMRANNDKLVKAINYKPYYIFKDGITELLEDISNDN